MSHNWSCYLLSNSQRQYKIQNIESRKLHLVLIWSLITNESKSVWTFLRDCAYKSYRNDLIYKNVNIFKLWSTWRDDLLPGPQDFVSAYTTQALSLSETDIVWPGLFPWWIACNPPTTPRMLIHFLILNFLHGPWHILTYAYWHMPFCHGVSGEELSNPFSGMWQIDIYIHFQDWHIQNWQFLLFFTNIP